MLTLVLIGAVGGFLSGLFGIGGGVILIPLLVYGGQIPIKIATSVSMVFIVFASVSGILAHRARGKLDLSTGVWMGTATVSGALVGSLLSDVFPEAFFYWLYIILVGAAVVVLLLPRRQERATHNDDDRHSLAFFLRAFSGLCHGCLRCRGWFYRCAAQKTAPRILRLFLAVLLIGILVWMVGNTIL